MKYPARALAALLLLAAAGAAPAPIPHTDTPKIVPTKLPERLLGTWVYTKVYSPVTRAQSGRRINYGAREMLGRRLVLATDHAGPVLHNGMGYGLTINHAGNRFDDAINYGDDAMRKTYTVPPHPDQAAVYEIDFEHCDTGGDGGTLCGPLLLIDWGAADEIATPIEFGGYGVLRRVK